MLTDSAVIDDEINKLFSRVPHHLHGSLVKVSFDFLALYGLVLIGR